MNITSYLTISSGYIALTMLFLILFIPLVPIFRYIDRRSLGVATFLYAFLHFLFYVIDGDFTLKLLLDDFYMRKFITVGYVALILFIPLLLTSNDRIQKKLASRWYLLHKSIYLIAIFSLLHYFLLIKADYLLFFLYSLLLMILFILKYRNQYK